MTLNDGRSIPARSVTKQLSITVDAPQPVRQSLEVLLVVLAQPAESFFPTR